MTGPILVVGATGKLGQAIVRKLLARGVPVRALARNPQKLEVLRAAGADIAAVDLLNLAKLTEVCRGVTQIVSTANNNMGSGPTSPLRVDLTGHQNLCAAARNTGVQRLVYVSYRGAAPDVPVDIFSLKWFIEDAIRRSGVPYVAVRPTALMDIWVNELLAPKMRASKTAMIFGDGETVANYIAVDDVADFVMAVLERQDIRNEVIEVGGPSDMSLNQMVSVIEKRLGITVKRRKIPIAMMRFLRPILKPFSETGARLMAIGAYAVAHPRPFPQWTAAAERFGVRPRTVETHVEQTLG